jgi:hypothetical protein
MENGLYPKNTVNWAVQMKIWELAGKVRAFSTPEEESGEGEAG